MSAFYQGALIGGFLGVFVGILIACLCVVASDVAEVRASNRISPARASGDMDVDAHRTSAPRSRVRGSHLRLIGGTTHGR